MKQPGTLLFSVICLHKKDAVPFVFSASEKNKRIAKASAVILLLRGTPRKGGNNHVELL